MELSEFLISEHGDGEGGGVGLVLVEDARVDEEVVRVVIEQLLHPQARRIVVRPVLLSGPLAHGGIIAQGPAADLQADTGDTYYRRSVTSPTTSPPSRSRRRR